LNLDFDEGTFD